MKILRETKRIVSRKGVLHFVRFAIIETRIFSVYLHRVYKEDEDENLHNHPWTWCRPFRIRGRYLEQYATSAEPDPKVRVGGRSLMRRTDYHKIYAVLEKPVVSLFFAGRRVDNWGYLCGNSHVDHREYRIQKHPNRKTD